jgi:hypothetical protein
MTGAEFARIRILRPSMTQATLLGTVLRCLGLRLGLRGRLQLTALASLLGRYQRQFACSMSKSNRDNDALEAKVFQDRGRAFVLIALTLIVGTSVAVISLYVAARGAERLPIQGMRFALTVLLALVVYRGHRWARWVTIVLIGGSGVVAMISSTSGGVIIGLVYLIAAFFLVTPTAGAFLLQQQRELERLRRR